MHIIERFVLHAGRAMYESDYYYLFSGRRQLTPMARATARSVRARLGGGLPDFPGRREMPYWFRIQPRSLAIRRVRILYCFGPV